MRPPRRGRVQTRRVIRLAGLLGRVVGTPALAFADDRLAPSERGGVTAVIENDLFGGKCSDRYYTHGLKLDGMTNAGAESPWAQRWYHQLIGATEPQGGRAQIPNQCAREIRLQRTKRNWRSGSAIGMAINVSPHYGLTLSGLNTAANAGIGFPAGWNLGHRVGKWASARQSW